MLNYQEGNLRTHRRSFRKSNSNFFSPQPHNQTKWRRKSKLETKDVHPIQERKINWQSNWKQKKKNPWVITQAKSLCRTAHHFYSTKSHNEIRLNIQPTKEGAGRPDVRVFLYFSRTATGREGFGFFTSFTLAARKSLLQHFCNSFMSWGRSFGTGQNVTLVITH